MKKISEIYDKKIKNEELNYLDKETCLLDIETTGFSRELNHIYMIGLARLVDENVIVTLLFAENRTEEKELLLELLEYSKDIKRFISFNGLLFDFPFIKSRMNYYDISYEFKKYEHLDIYKECKCLKQLLSLTNIKQKSFEAFLGLEREDIYSGGELISQYKSYEACNDADCYHNLITHNLEDVKGMVDLLTILRYLNIGEHLEDSTINDINVDELHEIKASLSFNYEIPRRFVIKSEFYYCIVDKNIIKIILSPIDTELKYYLKDYKNYMYLLNEDIIIPKQLLNAQNKKDAVPAKKDNCYIKTQGLFLPIYDDKFFDDEKTFKEGIKSKEEFIDIKDHLDDQEFIKKYIIHVIKYRLNKKKC